MIKEPVLGMKVRVINTGCCGAFSDENGEVPWNGKITLIRGLDSFDVLEDDDISNTIGWACCRKCVDEIKE